MGLIFNRIDRIFRMNRILKKNTTTTDPSTLPFDRLRMNSGHVSRITRTHKLTIDSCLLTIAVMGWFSGD
jgi:hypothetical protein